MLTQARPRQHRLSAAGRRARSAALSSGAVALTRGCGRLAAATATGRAGRRAAGPLLAARRNTQHGVWALAWRRGTRARGGANAMRPTSVSPSGFVLSVCVTAPMPPASSMMVEMRSCTRPPKSTSLFYHRRPSGAHGGCNSHSRAVYQFHRTTPTCHHEPTERGLLAAEGEVLVVRVTVGRVIVVDEGRLIARVVDVHGDEEVRSREARLELGLDLQRDLLGEVEEGRRPWPASFDPRTASRAIRA